MARLLEKCNYQDLEHDDAPLLGRISDGSAKYPQTTIQSEWFHRSIWAHPLTLLNLCLFLASAGLFSLAILSADGIYDAQRGLQKASFYSPLFDLVNLNFVMKTVSAPLFAEESLTPHDKLLRSPPSNAVDTAWKDITEVGIVTINTEDVLRLGKDPSATVKAPAEWGFGADAHLAQIDGQHALHCLNAVRRYAYREYYFPDLNTSSDGSSPHRPWDQAHLSHCLHVLLQTLTCSPSMDIITHNWMEAQPYPFPDFAIQKKCVDHSQVIDWQAKHKLSKAQWMEMAKRGPRPEDDIVPMPSKLKEWAMSDETVNEDHKS